MVARAPTLDAVFTALADPTRRAIVSRLTRGPATAGDLARPFPVSLPAVSKHLRVLERAGLVHRRIDGRRHHFRLGVERMKTATDWLISQRTFWEEQFEALDRYLAAGGGGQQEEERP